MVGGWFFELKFDGFRVDLRVDSDPDWRESL
jgi:ATP-dependent DNA ligase